MIFKKTYWWIGLLYVCLSMAPVHGQNIVLRGVVSDQQTGKPLELANVILQKISSDEIDGTTTDNNGLYEFNDLEPGSYLFTVRYVGYVPHADTLTLNIGQNIVNHVRMRRSSESLQELTVFEEQDDDLDPGQTSIRAEDLRRAPSPAGSADLAGFLLTQPGVVSTGDRGGQLFIRGGTPSENLVLMDGTLVYQPFHILGFFSVFPEEVISKVDLYAGGFGAKFSSRTSSVMDIRIKNGNLYNKNWSASVSPFISGLHYETPLSEGKSSLMVSVRGSLIEESSKQYLDQRQPLKFNSQMVKYSNIGQKGNCSALFMRSYDRGKIDFDKENFFKWNNIVTGGRCTGISNETSVSFMEVHFGLSHLSNEVGSIDSPGRTSTVFKSHVDANITQYLDDKRLEYGFFTDIRKIKYNIAELFLNVQKLEESFLSSGAFATINIPLGNNVSVEPGLSYTTYIGRYKAALEPRLQITWQPRGRVDEEIQAAFGVYSQPLVGLTDFRDAGTAFTTWMPIPDKSRRMDARHALLGWRQPIGRYLDFSAEGYYKQILDSPISVWSPVAQLTTELAYADGSVYGADLRIDFDHRHVYFGVGYGYSVTEYETSQEHFEAWFGQPEQRYNPPHDRRHQVNAHAGLHYGNFNANISWKFGTGLPFTRPIGFDSFFSFRDQVPDVRGDYGDPRVLLDKPYQGRLPDFHRLDISLEQAFDLSTVKLRIQAGAINLYDRENIFYFDVFTQRRINQLAFMPYVSLKMESI